MASPEVVGFVVESWRIEGIDLPIEQARKVATFHETISRMGAIDYHDLERAALMFTDGKGKLRWTVGMNVRVGGHYPPPGGPEIEDRLKGLCEYAAVRTPYMLHQEFENLHPFMDGNGRTGRLLWLWSMRTLHGGDWQPRRGFLHEWYYQSLNAWTR